MKHSRECAVVWQGSPLSKPRMCVSPPKVSDDGGPLQGLGSGSSQSTLRWAFGFCCGFLSILSFSVLFCSCPFLSLLFLSPSLLPYSHLFDLSHVSHSSHISVISPLSFSHLFLAGSISQSMSSSSSRFLSFFFLAFSLSRLVSFSFFNTDTHDLVLTLSLSQLRKSTAFPSEQRVACMEGQGHANLVTNASSGWIGVTDWEPPLFPLAAVGSRIRRTSGPRTC